MHRISATLVLVATVISACGPSTPNAIDGWPLGNPACSYECPEIRDAATKALDDQFRSHPGIVKTEFFAEGTYRTSAGRDVLVKRSGGLIVVVFSLEGGVRHAIGVHCGVGPCGAVRPLRQDEIDQAGIPLVTPPAS